MTMDEAQLKEFELHPEYGHADHHEVAEALRAAWAERDVALSGDLPEHPIVREGYISKLEAEVEQWKSGYKIAAETCDENAAKIIILQARADRAEAEVAKYQQQLAAYGNVQQERDDLRTLTIKTMDQAKAEIERLKAQCLLAGIQGAKDGDEIAAIYKAERDALREAAEEVVLSFPDVVSLPSGTIVTKTSLEKINNLRAALAELEYKESP